MTFCEFFGSHCCLPPKFPYVYMTEGGIRCLHPSVGVRCGESHSLKTATRDCIIHLPWEVCCAFCHLYRVSFQLAVSPELFFFFPWAKKPAEVRFPASVDHFSDYGVSGFFVTWSPLSFYYSGDTDLVSMCVN